MENYKNTVKLIHSDTFDLNQTVCLIEFLCNKIDINTISGMARSENKTPSGIRKSNKYRKINIGDAALCIKGLNDTKLPF